MKGYNIPIITVYIADFIQNEAKPLDENIKKSALKIIDVISESLSSVTKIVFCALPQIANLKSTIYIQRTKQSNFLAPSNPQIINYLRLLPK